jgi:molybdenum cofactor cytidylyltransferase
MTEKSDEIWAIVLAAGESRRMGEPKMVMPFGGNTIIETVIENATLPQIHKIIIVTGGWKEEVMNVLKKKDFVIITNENYKSGMFSSVQAGIRGLPESASAFMILHGDMPMVGQGVVNKLTEAFSRSGKGIAIPVYEGRRGHPVLISMRFHDELLAMSPDMALRDFMEVRAGDILEVESSPEVLRDIDTREDYYKELKLKS